MFYSILYVLFIYVEPILLQFYKRWVIIWNFIYTGCIIIRAHELHIAKEKFMTFSFQHRKYGCSEKEHICVINGHGLKAVKSQAFNPRKFII